MDCGSDRVVATDWTGLTGRRNVDRPAARWPDDTITIAGQTSMRLARGNWDNPRDACPAAAIFAVSLSYGLVIFHLHIRMDRIYFIFLSLIETTQ